MDILQRLGRQGDLQTEIALANWCHVGIERAMGVAVVDILHIDAPRIRPFLSK